MEPKILYLFHISCCFASATHFMFWFMDHFLNSFPTRGIFKKKFFYRNVVS